jgi:hypothetical protein
VRIAAFLCGSAHLSFRRIPLTDKAPVAKNQNTFEKRRREIEKKQRAEDKRKRRQTKKDMPEPVARTVDPPEDEAE